MLAWLLIVVLDVVIAWALYRVFRPVSPAVSMLAAVFRFAYAAVLLVAIGQLLRAVDVLTAGSTLAASADEVAGRALLELNAFQDLYDLGLFLFGIHLALLGYLSLRSDFIPKVVGALLVVAGAGYAFDTVGAVLALELPRVSAFTSSVSCCSRSGSWSPAGGCSGRPGADHGGPQCALRLVRRPPRAARTAPSQPPAR